MLKGDIFLPLPAGFVRNYIGIWIHSWFRPSWIHKRNHYLSDVPAALSVASLRNFISSYWNDILFSMKSLWCSIFSTSWWWCCFMVKIIFWKLFYTTSQCLYCKTGAHPVFMPLAAWVRNVTRRHSNKCTCFLTVTVSQRFKVLSCSLSSSCSRSPRGT